MERVRIAMLGEQVGRALTRSADLPETLQSRAEALVQHLEAAFARIWTLDASGQVLQLRASAGMYTRLKGTHSRIPIGRLKIGRIAQTRQPHLTNEVQTDPEVDDRAWAMREGLRSFAGYPLVVEDQLLSVMALFARRPLSDLTLKALASNAGGIALGIKRAQAEEALRESEEQ